MKKTVPFTPLRAFSLFLCLLIILPVMTATASLKILASPEKKLSEAGGFVPSKYLSDTISDSAGGAWEASAGSLLKNGEEEDVFGILSYSEKVGGVVRYETPLSLLDYYELGVVLTPIYGNVTVTLTAYFGNDRVSYSVYLEKISEYFIYIYLPEDVTELHGLSFTADFSSLDKKNPVSSVNISLPFLSKTDHTDTANMYSAFSFSRDEGGIGESIAFEGCGVSGITNEAGCQYAAELTVSGESGSLSFFYSADGEKNVSCGSSVLRTDRDSYMFLLPADVKISPLSSYRIEFTGVGAAAATVSSVEFHKIPIPLRSSEAGEISKCTVENGKLTLSGTLTRDTVVNYIDGTIRLIEVLPWEMDTPDILSKKEPLEEIPMSSSFTFSKALSPLSAELSAFGVVVSLDDEVVPLGDIIYPDTKTSFAKSSYPSSASLGISPENALIAGYGGFVIPVNADTLLSEDRGNVSALSVGERRFSSDPVTVENISSIVQFLRAAGIEPVFYISAKCTESLLEEDFVMRLYAAVSYLSDTFDPAGIILSSSTFECGDGGDPCFNSLCEYAAPVAMLMRAVRLSASANAFVAMEEVACDDSDTLLWYATVFTRIAIPTDFDYIISALTPGDAQFAVAAAYDGGYSSHISIMLHCSGADAPEILKKLSPQSNTTYVLSLSDGEILDVTAEKTQPVTTAETIPEKHSALSLFDFSDSYNVESVTPSLRSDGVFIRKSDLVASLSPKRNGVLRTTLTNDAPVLILSPTSPMDITSMPLAEISFATKTSSSAILDVVLISGSSRVVHSIAADSDSAHRLLLDLSGTAVASSFERIVFVLKDGAGLTLELSSVNLHGEGKASSPEDLFVTETTSPLPNSPAQKTPSSSQASKDVTDLRPFMAVALVTVISVVIFVLLSIGGNGRRKLFRRK